MCRRSVRRITNESSINNVKCDVQSSSGVYVVLTSVFTDKLVIHGVLTSFIDIVSYSKVVFGNFAYRRA